MSTMTLVDALKRFNREGQGGAAWLSNTQFQSKVARLKKLRVPGLLPAGIEIFFVRTSPRKPKCLAPKAGTTSRAWMCDAADRRMHVLLHPPDDFSRVLGGMLSSRLRRRRG